MSTAPTAPKAPVPAAAPRPSTQGGGGPAGGVGVTTIDPLRLLRTYYPYLMAAGMFGIIFGIATFFVLVRTAPKWSGNVQFEAQPAPRDASDPQDKSTGEGGTAEMERFMATQAMVMESDVVLSQALKERRVQNTVWAQDFMSAGVLNDKDALKAMREIVAARAVPDTTILTLKVTTSKKNDAPEIANTISEVYLDHVRRNETRDKNQLIIQFEQERRNLESAIDATDKEMENILGANLVTALEERHSVEQYEVQNLQPQLVELIGTTSSTREQLQQYEEIMNAEGGIVYPEGIRSLVEQSPIVQQQDANIASQNAILRSLKEEYGDRHREVQRLQRVIRALTDERNATVEREMGDQFGATIEGLRQSIANNDASISELTDRLQAARTKLAQTTRVLKIHGDLETERSDLQRQLTDLNMKIRELELLVKRTVRIRQLQAAQIPDEMSFPRLVPTVALSVFFWGGLVAGIIFLREIREQRVRGPQDIALIPRTRVIGFVPDVSLDMSRPKAIETACLDNPDGAIAESIRQIRNGVLKHCDSHGHKSVLVVSGLPGSGTSAIIANLAINAAAADFRVLVIDANVRRPSIHNAFSLQNTTGLGDVLLRTTELEAAIQPASIENVDVLCAGTRDNRVYERLSTQAMHQLVKQCEDAYDMVFVDAPPAAVASDAFALAGHCDAAILVVRAYSEKRGLVVRLRNNLVDTKVDFLGVIVNGVRASAGGYFKRNIRATHEYARSFVDDGFESDGRPKKARKRKDKKRKNKKGEEPLDVAVLDPDEQLMDEAVSSADPLDVEQIDLSDDIDAEFDLDDEDMDGRRPE